MNTQTSDAAAADRWVVIADAHWWLSKLEARAVAQGNAASHVRAYHAHHEAIAIGHAIDAGVIWS